MGGSYSAIIIIISSTQIRSEVQIWNIQFSWGHLEEKDNPQACRSLKADSWAASIAGGARSEDCCPICVHKFITLWWQVVLTGICLFKAGKWSFLPVSWVLLSRRGQCYSSRLKRIMEICERSREEKHDHSMVGMRHWDCEFYEST